MKLKRNAGLALVLTLVAVSGAARADMLADIHARGELKCAVYSDVPPFSAPDPKPASWSGWTLNSVMRWQNRWESRRSWFLLPWKRVLLLSPPGEPTC